MFGPSKKEIAAKKAAKAQAVQDKEIADGEEAFDWMESTMAKINADKAEAEAPKAVATKELNKFETTKEELAEM